MDEIAKGIDLLYVDSWLRNQGYDPAEWTKRRWSHGDGATQGITTSGPEGTVCLSLDNPAHVGVFWRTDV